jgi:four helix bundle protein
MSDYKKLLVWQKAIELTKEIYRLTKLLPEDEKYGLSSQMRRSAVSIPSNIAEGHNRGSDKDFIHFLKIAQGSKAEIETQLIICEQLLYLNNDDIKLCLSFCTEIDKMINSLVKKARHIKN